MVELLQDLLIIRIEIRVILSFQQRLISYIPDIIVNTMAKILKLRRNIVKNRLFRELKLQKSTVL